MRGGLLLLVLLALLGPLCSRGGHGSGTQEVCDDGKYEVDRDLGPPKNRQCQSERFPARPLYLPAGHGNCGSPEMDNQQFQQCMSVRLHYQDQPPTYGSYRPLAPMAGEYEYLPPQRWLHTIKTGGVAFIYHPCADEEQVDQLRAVARGYPNHVLTPYPNLTKEEPLAVLTWTCVYKLEWVHPPEIKKWLGERKLTMDARQGEGVYNKGLLSLQEQGSAPSASPSTQPPCPPKATSSRGKEAMACEGEEVKQSLHGGHSKTLTILTVLLGIVLLAFALLLLWKALAKLCQQKPQQQKYKSVSKYFPFSYKQASVDVVIPELGMPKDGGAERQILLNDSDEDEF